MQHRRIGEDKDERLLVLTVDIDNDLYRKTGISGPLMGRVQNLNGASQLALADPEDTDSNAMFEAVKLYDELRKEGYLANIATITGAEKEGYDADREIARQLELVLDSSKADACVLVTDGASDRRVLPIIQSRIKINSTKIVTVKQADTLENTYFTLLEKLKEPHYARIVFGIPAMLILLFAISYLLGAGWEPPVALIGIYLLMKGFNLEDSLINSFRGFGFSIDRMSFALYLSSIVFILISVFIGLNNYFYKTSSTGSSAIGAAYGIEGFLLLIPIAMTLYLIGRIMDVRSTKYMFRSFKYAVYVGSSIVIWVLSFSFIEWIIGQIYFSQFLLFTILAIAIGIADAYLAGFFRKRAIKSKRLKDKVVVNELGALIGKVHGVDLKKGRFVINTSFGNLINYGVDRIVEISDKIVVK